MTTRLWSILTAVAVVVSAAAATPAAAAPSEAPSAGAARARAATGDVVGEQVTVTGTVRRLALTATDGTSSTVTAIVTPDGEVVQVRTEDLAHVPGLSQVQVSLETATAVPAALDPDGGAAVADVALLTAPSVEGAVAQAPAVPGPRDVHVLSSRLPHHIWSPVVDLAPAVAAVVGASDYFSTSTGGAVSLAVVSQRDVGAYPYWGDLSTCHAEQIFGVLDWAAEQAGIYPAYGSGKHVIIQTEMFAACQGVPGVRMIADIDDGGSIWINEAGSTPGWPIDPWVVTRQLGHTLGLGESGARMDCRGLADGHDGECHTMSPVSYYDVMGMARTEHPGPLNAAQLEILGLLNSTNTVAGNASRTVTLKPVGGLSGLRFFRFTSHDATYFVEYRGAVGPDSDLGSTFAGCPEVMLGCVPTEVPAGVVVHRVEGVPTVGSETDLVDVNAFTHLRSTRFDLAAGRWLTTQDGGYVLTTTSVTPGVSATVSLRPGPGYNGIHQPTGNFESLTTAPGTIRVRGWAIDRSYRAPAWIAVSINGRAQPYLAQGARPDIAAAFPEQGSERGFDLTLNAAAGPATVCITAHNAFAGSDTSLGCRTVTVPGGSPVGVLESVTVQPGAVTFTGWALDPDTAASSYVYLSAGAQSQYARADRARPDVARFFPAYGQAHGFTSTLTALPGTQQVCATAVNHGSGVHTSLGCRTVTVPSASPVGNLEALVVSGGKVTFRGWSIDPDVPGPVTMWIDVDGRGLMTTSASQPRADVGRVFPEAGPNHGFTGVATLPPGAQRVCVWAVNNGRGSNTNLGCWVR